MSEIRIKPVANDADWSAIADYWKGESGTVLPRRDGVFAITKDGAIVGMVTLADVSLATFHITPGESVFVSKHAFDMLRTHCDMAGLQALLLVNNDSPLKPSADKLCKNLTSNSTIYALRQSPGGGHHGG